jgi:hypothetical protein
MATMKTKADLADKFSGASSLLYQSAKLTIENGSIGALAPELDVPVKVDTLTFEQGEPDIEHYKVIGLPGDWVTSSEPGDIDLSFRVPTKHSDVLKMAYGNDAVKENVNATILTTYTAVANPSGNPKTKGYYELVDGSYVLTTDTTVTEGKTYYEAIPGAYTGTGLVLQQKKIDGTFIFVSEDQNNILILTNTTLWAKPVLDQDAKGVFALDFNGTIETDGTNPDILFLTKAV